MGDHLRRETVAREAASSAAVDACLIAAAVAGASTLAWWSVAFHPSNSRLWMVPVGLVLACTPAIVCISLHLSAEPRVPGGDGGGKGADGAGATAQPMSAVVIEKIATGRCDV